MLLQQQNQQTETGNDYNDIVVVLWQIETDLGDDVTITKVVESTLDKVEFIGWKSIKLESDESQCEDNSNSDSKTGLEKIISDVLSIFKKRQEK